MRRWAAVVAAGLLGLVPAAFSTAQTADAIVGRWLTAAGTENGQAQVEVTGQGGVYSGRIVWLEKPTYPPDDEGGMGGLPRVDRNNPDPARHSAPIVGLEIVRGFRHAGGNQWRDGTIYDPDNGKTYSCKARLEGNVLKLRGYIGISLIGRTTEWTRAEAPPPAPKP